MIRSVALWMLIALGISLRFVGTKWDEEQHLHPDERFLTMTVPTLTWPHTLAEYFETRHATLSPFNHDVNFFIYGQLPLNLAKIVATVFKCDDYNGMLVVGRILSALFDAGSVLLLFFIGKRLAGRTVGLLSAVLLAFTVLNIQQSHFFVVDTFATFFLLAAFLCALRWLDAWPPVFEGVATEHTSPNRRRAVRGAIASGIFWGAAMACKIPCALFALIVFIFAIDGWRRVGRNARLAEEAALEEAANVEVVSNPADSKAARRKKGADEGIPPAPLDSIKVLWRRSRWLLAGTTLLLMTTAFVTFRILHPVAFEGSASPLTLWGFLDIRPAADAPGSGGQIAGFWKSFRDTADIAAGRQDLPWNLQWIGRPKIWFSLRNLLIWAIGWPLVLTAITGMGLIFWRALSRKTLPIGLLAAAIWSVLIFGYYSTTYMNYARYCLIITPFIALCAAWFGAELWRAAQASSVSAAPGKRRELYPIAALFFNGFVLNATALWALACASIYTRPHPRLEASRWMREHLPPRAAIAYESAWDDIVPVGGTGEFQMLDLRLYDADDTAKRQNFIDTLTGAQYIIITSNRVWGSVPRLPQRWPLSNAYYHALFEGQLGFRPIREWTSYPHLNLFGWIVEFPDDTIEESLSVYDHPRVALFEKTADFSPARVGQILDPLLLAKRSPAPLFDYIQSGWAPDESTLPWLPRVPDAK